MPYDQRRDDRRMDQVLEGLQTLTETVGKMREVMATRDDLRTLVTTEVYAANRAADGQRIGDHAQRLTNLETKYDELRGQMFDSRLREVAQISQVQAGTQQQIGQVAVGAQQQISHAQGDTNKLIIGVYGVLLTIAGSAVLQLALALFRK